MKKKNILVTLVSLIVVLSIGLTYALFYTSVTQSDLNALNTSCFDVSYTENSNSINLINSYPMKDSKGLKLEPYTFTITNTCNTTSEYVVTLNTTNSSSTILLPYINMSLDGSTIKKLNSYEITSLDNNLINAYKINTSYVIDTRYLEGNESETYNINLWIDKSAGNNIMGEEFIARVLVTNLGINESPFDFSITALYIEDNIDSETYTQNNKFPINTNSIGYTINREKTNCDKGNIISSSYYGYTGSIDLNVITNEKSKCIVYLDKNSIGTKYDVSGDKILATWQTNGVTFNNTIPNFTQVETTEAGIYKAPDDYGTSYYVRGASSYNYVKFGKDTSDNDLWWRIIRINGDGSLRLIYQGSVAEGSTPALTGNTTGINVSEITNFSFSVSDTAYNNNAYAGYMYTLGERQGLTESSNAKTQLEAWYETNLKDNYDKYIADKIFCGDRSCTGTNCGIGTSYTEFGARVRIYTNKTPTLICPEAPDKYTTTNANHGNKSLTYPIGLITADEVAMAGGLYDTGNTGYYLYTNTYYWTMSPYRFDGTYVREWRVSSSGFYHESVHNKHRLRAVINLSPDAPISGNGTTTDPFTIS